ncbi:hypothetical protein RBB50_010743 [Rhinocladiella similis]
MCSEEKETLSAHDKAHYFTNVTHEAVYDLVSPLNPSNSFAGKVVLVTGGGKGIGRAIAFGFAQAGARGVILVGRDQGALEASRAGIEKSGAKVLCYEADITSPSRIHEVFNDSLDVFGGIDVLVNNAGYLPTPQVFDKTSSLDDFWQGFEVNVKGGVTVTLQFLKSAKPDSTIINISSGAAHVSFYDGYASYSASKLALMRIMEFVQNECPHVRVFSLQPGTVLTDMTRKSAYPTHTDIRLPAAVCVWMATRQADFLKGRLIWANWDIKELLEKKDTIIRKNLLRIDLAGL